MTVLVLVLAFVFVLVLALLRELAISIAFLRALLAEGEMFVLLWSTLTSHNLFLRENKNPYNTLGNFCSRINGANSGSTTRNSSGQQCLQLSNNSRLPRIRQHHSQSYVFCDFGWNRISIGSFAFGEGAAGVIKSGQRAVTGSIPILGGLFNKFSDLVDPPQKKTTLQTYGPMMCGVGGMVVGLVIG